MKGDRLGIWKLIFRWGNKKAGELNDGLSDEEKQQSLSGIETTIKDIQIESDNIHNKIESAKEGN